MSVQDEDELASWRELQWATTLIMKRFSQDLAGHGLTLEEFDVLIHLVEGELRLQDLADSMVLGGNLSRSGLTRLLDRMERDSLIRRRLSRLDRRRFDIAITTQGRARFEAAWPEHQEGIRRYFSDQLTDADRKCLRRATSKLIDANTDQIHET